MMTAKRVRNVLDVLLAAAFLGLMVTSTDHAAGHEFLGVAAIVLALAHVVLNRKRMLALLRGGWASKAEAFVDFALVAGVACMLASALVLSVHAFSWLPVFPGSWWARLMHLCVSSWVFLLASVHAGLHLRGAARALWHRAPGLSRAVTAAWVLCAPFALWSFGALHLADYLVLRVPFAMVDPNATVLTMLLSYASVAVLLAGAAHFVQGAAARAKATARRSRAKAADRGPHAAGAIRGSALLPLDERDA